VIVRTIFFSLLCFIGIWSPLNAQQLSLVSSNGGTVNTGSFKGSYSVGEPIITSHLLTNNKLTQGFQQTFIFSTSSEELVLVKHLKAYPNPASNEIFIKTDALQSIGHIKVYAMSGKLIDHIRNSELDSSEDIVRINCNYWQSGIHILQVFDPQNRPVHSFTIIKL